MTPTLQDNTVVVYKITSWLKHRARDQHGLGSKPTLIQGYANSRFILTMFPIDLNAKYDITLIGISRRFQI